MPVRLSTGLVNKLMATGSFKSIFTGCFIDVYTGVQPASADQAATGTRLVTLTVGGDGTTGLSWESTPNNGELEKAPGELWQGTIAANGVAGWFRIRESGDNGTSDSSTAARFDGSIGTSGQQMNLGSLQLTQGAPFIVSAAAFTLPTA